LERVGKNGGGGKAGEVSSVHPDHYRANRSWQASKMFAG
jgi:hypothetical protein